MRPWNSETIRGCAASRSWWLGVVNGPSFVPLLMRPGVSAYDQPWLQFALNAYAPMPYSSHRISRGIGPSRAWPGNLPRHTDLVEPLSLDEAYLDVTENKMGLPTATQWRAPSVNKSARSYS